MSRDGWRDRNRFKDWTLTASRARLAQICKGAMDGLLCLVSMLSQQDKADFVSQLRTDQPFLYLTFDDVIYRRQKLKWFALKSTLVWEQNIIMHQKKKQWKRNTSVCKTICAVQRFRWFRKHQSPPPPPVAHRLSVGVNSPPGPAARCLSVGMSAVQTGCAGRAWKHGVCSISPHPPQPFPQTSPTCRYAVTHTKLKSSREKRNCKFLILMSFRSKCCLF